MYKKNLRYKKIKDFVESLNEREINYLYRKLKNDFVEKKVAQLSPEFLKCLEQFTT